MKLVSLILSAWVVWFLIQEAQMNWYHAVVFGVLIFGQSVINQRVVKIQNTLDTIKTLFGEVEEEDADTES